MIIPPVKTDTLMITSPYGPRGIIFHRGVDIRSVVIQPFSLLPVVCCERGVVMRCGTDRHDNDFVVIVPENDDVNEIKYIHIDIEPGITAGTKLFPGDLLGYTQIKGQSKAHHLHFEVWGPTGHFDPIEYFYNGGVRYEFVR